MTNLSSATSQPLWPLIEQTTRQALASGALQPIATQTQMVADGGISFVVRIVDSLVRKDQAQRDRGDRPQTKPDNPFLPYEEALWVTDLSSTHVCLLNKFNVVDHHLLIITRQYESQEDWLTVDDFVALAHCLREVDGLGFYNSGPMAGASQHHKHLQLVPLSGGGADLPINTAIQAHPEAIATHQLTPALPFQHRVEPLDLPWTQATDHALGTELFKTYRRIIGNLGLALTTPRPAAPYNLLITRDWMIGIQRSQASYQGIHVNSLGYAGWLLVKTPEALARLQQITPLTVLTKVGLPLAPNSATEAAEKSVGN